MGRKEEGGRGYRGATREVGRWAREDRCRGERSVEGGRREEREGVEEWGSKEEGSR